MLLRRPEGDLRTLRMQDGLFRRDAVADKIRVDSVTTSATSLPHSNTQALKKMKWKMCTLFHSFPCDFSTFRFSSPLTSAARALEYAASLKGSVTCGFSKNECNCLGNKSPGIHFLNRGKVRDLYEVGDQSADHRHGPASAFDVVLPTPIPDKGRVLTQLSLFWFDLLRDVIPNHIVTPRISRPSSTPTARSSKAAPCFAGARNRCPSSASCADTCPAPDGRIIAPPGKSAALRCRPACRNPTVCRKPIFTPSTKATAGHDENISFDRAAAPSAASSPRRVRAVSLEIYRRAVAYAEPRGIILADTKFEFGLVGDQLIWIDEALTPDSSRFWPAEGYQPGRAQPSARSTTH